MSFTVAEFHDLVRLVEERPEWRAELRRLVLTEELLALPEQVTRLRRDTEQGFQQLAAQVAGLTAAQVRTEEQMGALSQAQARTEQQLTVLSQAQARTEEQLTALSQAQARTEQQLTALSQAQARTEEQMAIFSQAQARTEEQMAIFSQAQTRTEEQMAIFSQAQARTEADLRWLVSWQRGEAGRRDGERYERETLRRAPALFHGGQGGPPERPDVQQRLTTYLEPLLVEDVFESENDPFLADLIWWKNEQVAIVEVSLQVDRQDVSRAERRARTLRRSGARVIAVVIGEHWATTEAREQAQVRQVEWKVDADLSEGFLAFRRQ